MNWTSEAPKESGWYWVRVVESDYVAVEVVSLLDGKVFMVGWDGPFDLEVVGLWGNKLEIPE